MTLAFCQQQLLRLRRVLRENNLDNVIFRRCLCYACRDSGSLGFGIGVEGLQQLELFLRRNAIEKIPHRQVSAPYNRPISTYLDEQGNVSVTGVAEEGGRPAILDAINKIVPAKVKQVDGHLATDHLDLGLETKIA